MTRPSAPGCDFCALSAGRWYYGAPDGDISLGTVTGPKQRLALASVGAWVACDACLQLIQRDDMPGLVERVIVPFCRASKGVVPRSLARKLLTDMYRHLWPHLGPPRPITAEQGERWRSAMDGWTEGDELSARAVAATLEPVGAST